MGFEVGVSVGQTQGLWRGYRGTPLGSRGTARLTREWERNWEHLKHEAESRGKIPLTRQQWVLRMSLLPAHPEMWRHKGFEKLPHPAVD